MEFEKYQTVRRKYAEGHSIHQAKAVFRGDIARVDLAISLLKVLLLGELQLVFHSKKFVWMRQDDDKLYFTDTLFGTREDTAIDKWKKFWPGFDHSDGTLVRSGDT